MIESTLNVAAKQPHNLVLRTRFLLLRDKRGTETVAKACDLPYAWLRKFRTGEIVSPGADRVQALYEFLTKKRLVK